MGCPRVGDCMRLVQRKMELMAKEVELLQVRMSHIQQEMALAKLMLQDNLEEQRGWSVAQADT
eukprot:CAMPEP_0198220184 /NCGR_PEP_ID=MMETSP1445-20131203/77988_1 /TAXON_ID=36898 /ORGANISM="Pyramimonas sp., Strain CCMP2087" /LENGTH=62 /DNA_ID=CAMNT_0043897873 /DNA_START=110 /DNA_END=298 /DNA_ORIENTATION=+